MLLGFLKNALQYNSMPTTDRDEYLNADEPKLLSNPGNAL